MSQPSPRNEILEATLDRFENGRGVLVFGDGQTFVVARRFLPRGANEGDVLELELITKPASARRRENLARAILHEILKGE